MSPIKSNPRIVKHPFADLMQGARLDSYEHSSGEIHMQVKGLEIVNSELFERDGTIMERVTARHVPLKLSFSNIQQLNLADFFTSLDQVTPDDPSRIIAYFYSWVQPGMDNIFHMLGLRSPNDAGMNFFTSRVSHEQGESGELFTLERDYSPSPPMPEGEVPQPYDIYDRFGGDPVSFGLNGIIIDNKLFVGGIENQPDQRPDEIGAVLNIGEKPSAWVKEDQSQNPNDRTVEKGEGSQGMSPEETNWVIERLKKNESVLIHCVAGMNRSTTITCAVLMQLEGLTAEQALERVYETHPWAKPDSHHWLILRWLETSKSK
ncbi:MAG TPA: dual specificity protein phosphatase [Anaerolineales bacterium]